MRTVILLILLSVITFNLFAQAKLRPLQELINTTNPGWPSVQSWIDSAKNKVEVLPADSNKAKVALFQTQVTTRSPMGAVVYHTGGILVGGGWIRILGSGHPRFNRSLPEWNKGRSSKAGGEQLGFFLVADDAMGGFFAVNGGAFSSKQMGKVYYLSPDNLEWEDLDLTYTQFLLFCFNTDLDHFYEGYRWKGWQKEVAALPGDKVYNFFPYLYTREGKNINNSSRSAIPVAEQFDFNMNMRKQLGLETNYHK
jgi:hypothetical protein